MRREISVYEALANAIVKKAADDYQTAYSDYTAQKSNTEKRYSAKREMESIRQFFHSQAFHLYSEVDPDYILSKIESIVDGQKKEVLKIAT